MPDARITQTARLRAADRSTRKHPADVDLSLDELAADEMTRRPVNARATKRAARMARYRAAKKLVRAERRLTIAARLAAPAPSRGAVRLVERLHRDYRDMPVRYATGLAA